MPNVICRAAPLALTEMSRAWSSVGVPVGLAIVRLPACAVKKAIEEEKASGRAKTFLKALGPAVLGSAGVQIALFADTIIASLLPPGSYAALYYAERLYQLPIGVIAIAAGSIAMGIIGALIAVPIAGAIYGVMKYVTNRDPERPFKTFIEPTTTAP